jgi:hypothetical protein
LTSVSPPPQFQRCWWISRHRGKTSPTVNASFRCTYLCFLLELIISYWLLWPLTTLWPSVTSKLHNNHEPSVLMSWLMVF